MVWPIHEALIRVAIRVTARISFVFFLGAFLSEAIYSFWPRAVTHWLKGNRDRFTLGFAASHTVHLAFIIALVRELGREHLLEELGRSVLIVFVIGFLFIYFLAAAALLRHHTFWLSLPRFESLAQYFLIILFAFAFSLSGLTKPLFYAPFVLAAMAALGFRIAAAFRSRRAGAFVANSR